MASRLNKEKYLIIHKNQGLHAAISALHEDMELLEFECFEGPNGYSPELYEDLKHFRTFSRELWDIELNAR